MRIECEMNLIRLVPETEVEAYYLQQFHDGEVSLDVRLEEAEPVKPTHADEEPQQPEVNQTISLSIWP